jgi:hypothetical protein
VNIPVFFSDMNPNPVPELETKKFAELLTHTLARANQLPNDELGQTLRSAIALSVLGNDILGKISASQAANIEQLGQMLATVSVRLDSIQTALSQLLDWIKTQQGQSGNGADWWKGSGSN